MAILVRYAEDERKTAIYLSQKFYKLIFGKAQKSQGYTVLSEVSQLKYKSPTMTVEGDRLRALIGDLDKLKSSMLWGKGEASEFYDVCKKALADSQALLISGDMHPELH